MNTDSTQLELYSEKVVACADEIRTANESFGKQFVEWVTVVGGELRKAQKLLARHKAGFENLCKDEFGWSPDYARKLIASQQAVATITNTIVSVVPSNEAQCRELACVPKSNLPEVWKEIVEISVW